MVFIYLNLFALPEHLRMLMILIIVNNQVREVAKFTSATKSTNSRLVYLLTENVP